MWVDTRSVAIATFNCEWRRTPSPDGELIRERIFDSSVDVVCLTETHHDFLRGEGHTIESAPFDQAPNAISRRKVLLWSRRPWTEVDAHGPQGIPEARYIAGTTPTAVGETRFIGVCIPYSFAGVRYGVPKRSPWELHFAYLDALHRALPATPELTVVLGDFNQRVPRRYQPKRAFDALERVLLQRFTIATSGELEPIQRPAIDHICHSRDLACRSVVSLSNVRPDGRQISDHFGVRVELVKADE